MAVEFAYAGHAETNYQSHRHWLSEEFQIHFHRFRRYGNTRWLNSYVEHGLCECEIRLPIVIILHSSIYTYSFRFLFRLAVYNSLEQRPMMMLGYWFYCTRPPERCFWVLYQMTNLTTFVAYARLWYRWKRTTDDIVTKRSRTDDGFHSVLSDSTIKMATLDSSIHYHF